MLKALEQAIPNKRTTSIGMGESLCGACGKPYDLAQRSKEVEGTLAQESKKGYCRNSCWIQESHNEDFS